MLFSRRPKGEVRRVADPKSLVAFLRIAEQHRGQLLWPAQRKTRNREEAEDIVQEALLKVFTHLALFGVESQMGTWLRRHFAEHGP
jgi:DNA-directed RNA polymerase specialized sigma24 family protein